MTGKLGAPLRDEIVDRRKEKCIEPSVFAPSWGCRAKITALGTYVPPQVLTNKGPGKDGRYKTTSGFWSGPGFASGMCWPRGWA